MMKKKRSTMIVSLSKGKADINAYMMILKPSIPLIVLRGLKTLKDLRTDKLTPSPLSIRGR